MGTIGAQRHIVGDDRKRGQAGGTRYTGTEAGVNRDKDTKRGGNRVRGINK